MRREESKGDALPGKDEAAEEHPLDGAAAGLADSVVTRAQAIKLAGLGGAGFLLTLLWPADADARRRRRKKKRRRKKAQVTNPLPLVVVPNVAPVLNITNPTNATGDLTISAIKVLDSAGKVLETIPVPDFTLEPGESNLLPVTITSPLADVDRLRLIDGRGERITVVDANGVPVTVVDENGVTVSVGDIDVA